jgi:hypothetical protein
MTARHITVRFWGDLRFLRLFWTVVGHRGDPTMTWRMTTI